MQQELFKLPPFISVILKRKDQILLVKRKSSKFYQGCFVLPGGKVDGGETIFQAALREVKEELGISLDIKSSKVVHVCHFKWENGFEGLDFYILATDWKEELRNLEPEKHEEPKWFNLNNLPHNTAPNHQKALEEINKKVFYSELGWK